MKKLKSAHPFLKFTQGGEFSAMANSPTIQLGGTANYVASIRPLGASNVASALNVSIVDASGNQITSFGGGSGGGGATDNTGFTLGTSTFSADGGVFNDALGALSSGQQGATRMTGYRALHANLRNSAGAEVGGAASPLYATLTSPKATLAGLTSQVTAYGALRVTKEPTALFGDPFDGTTIDTANRWNTPNVSGTGASVTQAVGGLVVTPGAAATSYASIYSQPTFAPIGVNFLAWGCAIQVENSGSGTGACFTNAYRFIGLGTAPTAPSIAAASTPTASTITDAIGFEIGTDGNFYAVIYQNGTNVYRSAALNNGTTFPLGNGQQHRLGMGIRADLIAFYTETLEVPSASFAIPSAGYALPAAQTLPARWMAVNAASAPSGTPTLTVSAFGIGDTGGNGLSISDGTYSWRKAAVSAAGALSTMITGPASMGGFTGSVMAGGLQRVMLDGTQLFYDGFDTGLDTTNKWKTPTSASGGVAATTATASYTALGTGTTAGGYSVLESMASFPSPRPSWLHVLAVVNVEYPIILNTYRFFGIGTSPSTPTTSAPVTEAVGFEIATNGKLYAVMYAGGVRNQIADLSQATGNGKQPIDSNAHTYSFYFQADRTYWCIDGPDSVVATNLNSGLGPNVNNLPFKVTAVAGATAPTSSGVLTLNAAVVADSGRNSQQLSDGTYPWRKVAVTASGGLVTNLRDSSGNAIGSTLVGAAYALNANIVANVGTSVDGASFTPGATSSALDSSVYNDSLTALSSATIGAGRMTAYRADHVNLRNNSGVEIGTSTTPLVASGKGTAGTPDTGVVSVQGVSGGTAVPISGAVTMGSISGTINLKDASGNAIGSTLVGSAYSSNVAANLRSSSGVEIGTQASPVWHQNVSNNGAKAIVDPMGYLMVRERSSVLFYDAIPTATLDAQKWATALSSGTVTQSAGSLAVAVPATASSYAQLYSQTTFDPQGTQDVIVDGGIFLPTSASNEPTFFFGFGTRAATPTTAAPITDGIGFIYNGSTGITTAVIWASGAVKYSSVVTPTLNAWNRYRILWSPTSVYFHLTDMDTPAASATGTNAPNNFTFTTTAFTVLYLGVAGTTAVAATLKVGPMHVGDLGRNNIQISDGNYPWRQGTVSGTGQQAVGYADAASLVYGNLALATTTQTALIAAGGTGIRTYLTSIVISNASTTAVQVTIQDGSTTLLAVYVAASGGSFTVPLPASLRGSAATAVNVTLSAATTGNVLIHASGFRSAY